MNIKQDITKSRSDVLQEISHIISSDKSDLDKLLGIFVLMRYNFRVTDEDTDDVLFPCDEDFDRKYSPLDKTTDD